MPQVSQKMMTRVVQSWSRLLQSFTYGFWTELRMVSVPGHLNQLLNAVTYNIGTFDNFGRTPISAETDVSMHRNHDTTAIFGTTSSQLLHSEVDKHCSVESLNPSLQNFKKNLAGSPTSLSSVVLIDIYILQ